MKYSDTSVYSFGRVLMLLAGFAFGSACVDLTPPSKVTDYRNGKIGQGGDSAGGVGGAGGVQSGGTLGRTGGSATDGGGDLASSGGATGAGGKSELPPGSGGTSGADAIPDAVLESGGVTGAGGAGHDDVAGAIGSGGSTGTGGVPDAAIGSGGIAGADGLQATGGQADAGGSTQEDAAAQTGGITETGGTTASGGTTATGGTTAGSGGTTGSGGVTGTGGTTSTTPPSYNCSSAISPASGMVTNFTDWNATTAKWGSGALTGNVYQYAGGSASMNTATVAGSPAGLHLTGSVPASAYGGGGLTFFSCVTVASFTSIAFDVYGSAAGCNVQLQIQTYDQRPVDQTPPGGCKADGGSSCFGFPVKSQVVDLSSAVASPGKTVSTTLASFTNWSASTAGQVVGLQWQFTSTGGTCTPNATFTNVKFLP